MDPLAAAASAQPLPFIITAGVFMTHSAARF
jgi:hypothetical protein